MSKTIEQQLASLRHLSARALQEKYLELFGEATRSGNKQFLAKRLAWRIQSLAEGGLSERAKQRAAELARDSDIRLTIPNAKSIRSKTAAPTHSVAIRRSDLPIPGTILTREYRGRRIEVSVLPKGFDYQGEVYRSLSGVAKVVTGSHWNGHLFFGLRGGK